MNRRLQRYFADYAEAHRTPGNKWTHLFGIPLIAFSLLGLLDRVAWSGVSAAWLLLGGAALFYLWLDLVWGAGLVAVLVAFLWAAARTPAAWLGGFFVLGWVLQFWGHYHFEKKSPKFLQNVLHIFVGPLWILVSLFAQRDESRP